MNAAYELAECYNCRDSQKTLYWYEKIATSDGPDDIIERARLALAQLYERGILFKQDLEKAIYWYEKAAEYNDSIFIQNRITALQLVLGSK